MWNRLIHDRRTLWVVRLAWVSYGTLLFVSTHLPDPDEIIPMPEGSDKSIHGGAFFVLAILTSASFPGWLVKRARHAVQLTLLLAMYAAFDELSQAPMGRTPDLVDWVSDLTGAAVGVALAWGAMRTVGSAGPGVPAKPQGRQEGVPPVPAQSRVRL